MLRGATRNGRGRFGALVAAAALMATGAAVTTAAVGAATTALTGITRVSVSSTGAQSYAVNCYGIPGLGQTVNHNPAAGVVSADGRYSVFESNSEALPDAGPCGNGGIYRHDLVTGQTVRVAFHGNGTPWYDARNESMSGDGRYVVFQGNCDASVVPCTNGSGTPAYLYDTVTGTVSMASPQLDGTSGDGRDPVLSTDGRYVAFTSRSHDMPYWPDGDNCGAYCTFHTYRYDRQTGEILSVDHGTPGWCGMFLSDDPAISGDGRYVAFRAYDNSNGCYLHGVGGVNLWDATTGSVRFVDYGDHAALSEDGSVLAYVYPQPGGGQSIRLRDTATLSLLADVPLPRPSSCCGDSLYSLSGDGSHLAYARDDAQVVVRDVATGAEVLTSVNATGIRGNLGSFFPHVSADGSAVVFQSYATNLVPNDTNSFCTVYGPFEGPDIFEAPASGGPPAPAPAPPPAGEGTTTWTLGIDAAGANPDGPWGFGYATATTGFAPMPVHTVPAPQVDTWRYSSSGLPLVEVNRGDVTYTPTCTPVAPGGVIVQPGPSGERGVVRWTAPADGFYAVSAVFTSDDRLRAATTGVTVAHGTDQLFAGALDSSTTSRAYTGTVRVAAGETLDFAVDYGSNRSNFADTTGVAVTIASADSTPPTVTASAAPPPNANGWNNGPVTVSFTCTDGESGVDAAASSLADVVLTASGTATGRCVDRAGNSATATYTALIDTTPPTVTASAAPPPNANGWNNGPVAVSFTCTDGESGVDAAASSLADVVLTASGTATGTCVDRAGNSATATDTALIDTTPPTVTFAGNAGSYGLLDSVAITCTTSDDLSGVATDPCLGFAVTGPAWMFAASNTLPSPGLVAVDRAGNSSPPVSTRFTVTATYDDLAALTEQLVGNHGRAERAVQKLQQLQNAEAAGNAHQAADKLDQYVQALDALVAAGYLTAQQADTLAGWAAAL